MATDPATLERKPAKRVADPDQRRLADFDEQLWPVNVLLLVLAAVVAGLIVARADFHTRDPWANGYVHLGILGAIVLVLALAAALLRRGNQRRMQLAVLASLLLHLWLSMGMHEYRLPQVASPHPRAPTRAHDVTLPDYHFHQLERPSEKQFFEQPLETEAARPQEAPRHEHQPPAPNVVPSSKPAQPKPLKPEPRPIDIKRADTSAPHRGERLPRPQKAPSRKIADPQPAIVARPKLSADSSRQAASQTPEPAASRIRPAAELEPRVAMARSPRTGQLPELQAMPAAAAAANHSGVQPAGAPAAPPAADRLARSSNRDSLGTQNVPVVPAAPAAGSGASGSPQPEIGAAAMTTGRTSRPAAAGLSPPPGLPLAGPGFDGPSMPFGSRVAGGSSSTETPEFEQPSLSRPTRSRRDDIPLAGEGAVAGSAGGQPAPIAGQAGPAGELEPALAPRSRGDRSLPVSSAGTAPATSGEELSLGDAPGAPAMRPTAGPADGLSPAAGPGLAVPLRKHESDTLVDGSVAAAPLAPAQPAARSGPAETTSGPSDAATGRVAGASALPLRSPAPLPSGPGDRQTVEPGIPGRRARPESNMLATDTPRMILERSGGELAIDARVRDTAVPGLKQRDRAGRKTIAQQRGGSVETEQAVERGLEFLARYQAADGSWQLHNPAPGFDYPAAGVPQLNSTTAATGVALLSFLGAGYTHTDGHHRQLVERALNNLLAHQRADGDLFQPQDSLSNSSAWLYSHGIASIAVCEAYGMTRDPRLREPAQRALDFIAAAQNPEEGGWRYAPRRGSDTSVSGWQLMALKSGELAGLKVPRDCYSRIAGWLDRAQGTRAQGAEAQGAEGHGPLYAYLPGSENPTYRAASTVMTAEALLMRQYLGWRRDHPEMIAGAQWLQQNLPQFGTPTPERPTADRNAYYWYYGTQVMFQMQGPYWQAWNSHVRPLLLESQTTGGELGGSWDPVYPLPDRYGYMVGRLYVTALHLLVLEVYYRHLPIYQTLEQAPGER